jgi:hypothetical protein
VTRRVHYHWQDREEFAGDRRMWRTVASPSARAVFIRHAAALMRQPDKFRAAMTRAVTEWPRSCETNLTGDAINQRAWLGHAGCYLDSGSPEDCTRLGWHELDSGQQRAANAAADDVIAAWRATYRPVTAQLDLFGGPGA